MSSETRSDIGIKKRVITYHHTFDLAEKLKLSEKQNAALAAIMVMEAEVAEIKSQFKKNIEKQVAIVEKIRQKLEHGGLNKTEECTFLNGSWVNSQGECVKPVGQQPLFDIEKVMTETAVEYKEKLPEDKMRVDGEEIK